MDTALCNPNLSKRFLVSPLADSLPFLKTSNLSYFHALINQKQHMNFPADLKYSKEHEWVRVKGTTAVVGISDFAQKELGDIVFVEIETVGDTIEKDGVFGTVEAVKTVSDLFLPVSGKILEKNEALNDAPEVVNSDPYGKGWMVKIEISDPSQLASLMDAEAYKKHVGA